MDLPRLPRPLPRRRRSRGGAPPPLPRVLDGLVERWWRLLPRVRLGIGLLVAVAALALVGRGATASPWGPSRTVLVAATDLATGQALTPGVTASASWPTALVPDDALSADDLATADGDVRVAGPIVAGSVLVRRHVVTGIAGLLDDGQAAVPVPVDGLPQVVAGDLVEVVATSPDGVGRRVASAARVLAVDGGFLWLGVPADRVDPVAAAGAAGRLTLAVRPARPPS